jgi:hypothetical protein
MVLLYSPLPTARLHYSASFIFSDRLRVPFRITDNIHELSSFAGIRINYADSETAATCFHIRPSGLLQELGIRPQNPAYQKQTEQHQIFPAASADCPFDLFSSCFYLISRYEEYLPHSKDSYGRFAHGESLAHRSGFLQEPVVDQWIVWLAGQLNQRFPEQHIPLPEFRFVPTYDIDNAFAFRHKNLIRTLGGWLRSPSLDRWLVLTGKKKDPYDSYDLLDEEHAKHGLVPRYFFLAAKNMEEYDKNIDRGPALTALIARHGSKYPVGLHPSWQSGGSEAVLLEEKSYLESVLGKSVCHSRQHFIRFNLPDGYRRLIDASITDDHSMGYGSINGFRASTGASFKWYDLEKETITSLKVHPFCYMEANSYYEQQHTAARALEELQHYFRVCKTAGTSLTTIWHNHFLGTGPRFAGWRETYLFFLNQVCR